MTVGHLASKCNKILDSYYTQRHKKLAKLIHYNICKLYNLTEAKNLNEHQISPVIEAHRAKLLWEPNYNEKLKGSNKPDLLLYNEFILLSKLLK